MATRMSKKLPAVAGRATKPLNPVANAVQQHLTGVIQAKSRIERQAEIRQAVAQQVRDTRLPGINPQHGQHVYIYSMKGTGRVIYSLTREIDQHKAKAQLTFVGKKSVPSAIRPDLWNPLAIVTFPTATQGLEAFRILREFRMRHEYEWRDHLQNRNDLPGKYKRMRLLSNQKPNSIADLAATLALQERRGKEELETRLNQIRQDEEKYDAAVRHLEELDAKIEDLDKPVASEAEMSVEEKSKQRNDLLLEKSKAKATHVEYSKRRDAAEKARQAASQEASGQVFEADAAGVGELTAREAFIQRRQVELLPSILSEMRNYGPLPKRGARRVQMICELLPSRQVIPTLAGVKVTWAQANDRGFAERWPADVEHEVMGVSKGAAPNPDHLRQDALWTDRAATLLEKYQGDGYVLLTRNLAQWTDTEARDYLDYLKVLHQQQMKQRIPFMYKIKRRERLNFTELAVQKDILAAAKRVEVMRRTIKAIDLRRSAENKKGTVESLERAAALSDSINAGLDEVEALVYSAQLLRGELEVKAKDHIIKLLNESQRGTLQKCRASQEGRDQIERITDGLGTGEGINGRDTQWLIRILMEAKGTDLTPEEQELISNVELDGESSGKNEDDVANEEDESATGTKDKPSETSKNQKKKTELEQKRQEEERKGLWGRMFGQSSSSSRDDRPNT